MSKTQFQTMPILMSNLGAEMIYILCSRLKAQNVQEDKAHKVINDVVLSLFEEKLTTDMFKLNDLSKFSYIKQVFERLAHSSIMKLNSNSMSKLFDLMIMANKLQLVRIRYPEEISKVTMNHLNSIIDIMKKHDPVLNKEAIKIVENFTNRLKIIFNSYSSWDYVILKQTLLRFFQGKNIKVSIFIQEKLQNDLGQFTIPQKEFAPPFVNRPGTLIEVCNNLKETMLNIHNSNYFIPSVSV